LNTLLEYFDVTAVTLSGVDVVIVIVIGVSFSQSDWLIVLE
jgi:hypothetical protein